MTTELSEDVVLITTPHIVTTDVASNISLSSSPNRGPFSGSVELGRRLLIAARHGQTSLVLDLMAKGAPFTTDWLGTSPLHVAASGNHVETCAVLLRAGVSRDSRTKVERTPLHLAAHAGHAAVASLLIERGALVDCKDMLRMTPLHWAAERGHLAVVSVLLRHGADPRAESKFYKTPVDLAAAKGHHAILKLIEDAIKEREAADSVDALKQADETTNEIPAAEQQQALQSIERLQETVKPEKPIVVTSQLKIEIEPEHMEKVEEKPVTAEDNTNGHVDGNASGNMESNTGGNVDTSAAALLRKHGITLLPHDSSSTVLNAIQSGRTVVLSDAGKLMLKESSSAPPPPPAPAPSKGMILTAAPVKTPPAGVKIFTLNNKLRTSDKLPVKKIINPQDMQIKLVSLADTKQSSPTRTSNVSMKAKTRRTVPLNTGRQPVKIIMQKANFDKIMGKNAENGMETGPIQITSNTNLAKVLQVSNAIPITPTATVIGSTAGVVGNTGGIIGNTGGIMANSGCVTGDILGSTGVSGTGFLCVPAEFLSSNSPAYLRSQLLSAHKTIHDLNQQVAMLKQQLAAYESLQ